MQLEVLVGMNGAIYFDVSRGVGRDEGFDIYALVCEIRFCLDIDQFVGEEFIFYSSVSESGFDVIFRLIFCVAIGI